MRCSRLGVAVGLLLAVIAAGAVFVAAASGSSCDQYMETTGTYDWGVAANWQSGLPGPNTSVCWGPDVTITVDSSDTGASAATASEVFATPGSSSTVAGPLEIDGGTLTLGSAADEVSPIASLTMSGGGTLLGAGTLQVSGAFDITSGIIGGQYSPASADPTIDAGSFLATNPGPPSPIFYGGVINVDGPATIDTTYFSSPNDGVASFNETGVDPIVLTPGAYGEDDGYTNMSSTDGYSISGDTDPFNYRLTQSGGATDVPSGDILYPGDTFELTGGTLQDDGTLGTGVTLTGGLLDGTGNFGATVLNTSGTVRPGDGGATGTLSMPSYIQSGGGTLTIPVNGTGAGQFSVLNVSGGVQLAGALALEPTGGFASAASPGESVEFLPFGGTLTGTFASTTDTQTFPDGEVFGPQYEANQVDAVVTLPAPANTTLPSINGQTGLGDLLTCSTGTWTGDPTLTEVWARNGTTIPGATGTSYTVTAADQGETLTCVVTGTNATSSATATSPGDAIPAAAPVTTTTTQSTTTPTTTTTATDTTSTPTNTTTTPAGTTTTTTPSTTTPLSAPAGGAVVTGTPLPEDRLTCSSGTWTGSPSFTYQWFRGQTPISGATSATYTVAVLDEGSKLTCAITGHNPGGAHTAVAAGVVVAQKGTLTCPKPSGSLINSSVGPLTLGAGKATERRVLTRYSVTSYGFDNFCLYGGWGIRAGYRAGKVVLLLTANPYYRLDGAGPGITIASVTKKLKVGKAFVIGLNDWYIAAGKGVEDVFKVRHGIIQEIGIANQADSSGTRAQQHAFLAGFKAA